jgi:hypothetical protein
MQEEGVTDRPEGMAMNTTIWRLLIDAIENSQHQMRPHASGLDVACRKICSTVASVPGMLNHCQIFLFEGLLDCFQAIEPEGCGCRLSTRVEVVRDV